MNIVSVYKTFPTEKDCLSHIEKVRWHGKPICPYCQSSNQTPLPKEGRYHCNNCNTTFSVTVGTIFHHTHLPLQKWFLALSLVLNAKKGISARQLGRDLMVNKDTAWRMAMKIRQAMTQQAQRELLTGVVEMDETYIGGKPRRGSGDGTPLKRGRGTKKTPVVGMIERDGQIRAKVVKNKKLNIKTLNSLVRENVDTENATLITDEYKGYLGIKRLMPHKVVDHTVWYVNGDAHTNNVESFWALLKRGIVGQYHKVSLRYLPKYIDEFCFRHNYRKHEDIFGLTLQRAMGV
ncbi:MAG: IS1595 family transposase [Smithella sp.]|jgi:transposase-like protein